MVLFVVELLLDVGRLLDVVVNFKCKLLGNRVLVSEFLENLELFASVLVLEANVCDNGTHPVDVISHHDATESLDENDANGLRTIHSHNVSEAYSQHNVSGPVKGPHILLQPRRIGDTFVHEPVMLWIKIGHSSHKEGDNVGIAEVNYKNLNEFPILFVIDISDEVHFYFFNFVQALGQFEDNKHSKDSHKVLLGSDVHQQDSHTHEVDPEVLRNVKLYDVLNHFYLSTC